MEVPVVTQGLTLDETLSNLREALALRMEDQGLNEIGLAPSERRDTGGLGVWG